MSQARRSIIKNRVDLILLLFLIFMNYAYYVSYRDHKGLFMLVSTWADPYFLYYSDFGIQVINNFAWLVDASCLLFLILKYVFPNISIFKLFVVGLCLVGAVLPLVELYWGSTFYYGEVRDKQQLPFLVNNFGVVGSLIFSFSFISGVTGLRK